MNNAVIHSPESYLSMPWRNGMGTTTELLKHAFTKDSDFCWRISMADVAEDGPFSLFDGYDRTLVLLSGEGVSLVINEQLPVVLSKPLDIARFRGDDKTCATLHGGPITDFNIMANRLQCRARVDCGSGKSENQTLNVNCDEFLIFAMDREIKLESDDCPTVTVPGQHLLQVKNVDHSINIQGTEQFIAIQIEYL